MAEVSADLGFDGLDITVRPKGHVLPERVVVDLPEAVDAMMGFGMKPGMITTEVWDLLVQKIIEPLGLGRHDWRCFGIDLL